MFGRVGTKRDAPPHPPTHTHTRFAIKWFNFLYVKISNR
jgi:hypothetical protein